MKSIAILSAILLAIGFPRAFAQSDSPKVAFVFPALNDEVGASYREPFSRGLKSVSVGIEAHYEPYSELGQAIARIHDLLERDRIEFIVVAGVPLGLLLNEARQAPKVGFFHASTTGVDRLRDLRDTRNIVTFGSLPKTQRDFLVASLSATKTPIVLGSTFQPDIVESLFTAVRASAGNATRLAFDPGNVDSFAERVRQTRPDGIGGVVDDREADQAAAALRRIDFSGSVILFSPPPAQTRAYLAARFVALALQSGARSPQDILAHIRTAPRFSGEAESITLSWSIRFAKLDETVLKTLGPPEFFGPDQQGSDNTQECSCKDKGGRQVSCKSCEPNKCSRTGDGQDDCTTKCSTQ